MDIAIPHLTAEEAEAIMASTPPRLGAQGRAPLKFDEVVLSLEPLTPAHYEAPIAANLPAPTSIQRLRHSHHRLAQLLANGMKDIDAGRLCGLTPQRVYQLKNDPAFAELLSHYAGVAAEEWQDFVSLAAELSVDMLEELRHRLDTEPGKFPPTVLLEAIKTLADRSGNAPMNRSINVNVNAEVGSRLNAARERLRRLNSPDPRVIEGESRVA